MWQAPFWERVVDVRLRRPRPIGFADKYGNAAKRTAVNFSYQPKAALNRKRDSLHTVSVGALIASKWFK